MSFALDKRLEADSVLVCDLPLSQVRLHKNAAFPWVLLIPRQNGIVEIIDLSLSDQEQLWHEIRQASQIVKKLFAPTKINVANLGNVVPQLHVHVVARYDTDKAWPGPIWNSGVKEEYNAVMLQDRLAQLKAAFEKDAL